MFKGQLKYQQKNKIKNRRLIVHVLGIIFMKRVEKLCKKSRYRMNVLKEWIKTQQSYRNDLQAGIRYIKKPLVEKKYITNDQGTLLCSGFQSMEALSKLMLEVFEQTLGYKNNPAIRAKIHDQKATIQINPNKILFGKKLCQIAGGYKTYSEYFCNHSHSQKLFMSLMEKQPQVMKQIEKGMQQFSKSFDQNKKNLTVKDCLDQPLYRLFKYDLLLKQYLKRLNKDHPDYNNLEKAQAIFRQINNTNNQKMRKLELQQKKIQLEKFLGRTLESSVSFIAQMKAQIVIFKVKVYIFNVFVILSKMYQNSIDEQKYLTIQFDEFSFVQTRNDTKYYKNILVITGSNGSVHLFFPNQGSRFQLFNCVDRVLKQFRVNEHRRRKRGGVQHKKNNKIQWTLPTNKPYDLCFRPSFRIEVIGTQVRPVGTMSNETVYITKLMLAQYYSDFNLIQDQQLLKEVSLFLTNNLQGSIKQDQQLEHYIQIANKYRYNWINQTLDLHLIHLQEIEQFLNESYPGAELPKLRTNFLTINAKGQKKTKAFEVMGFAIEQFLNTIFRHQDIMKSPLEIAKKLKIESAMWEYAVDKTEKILNSGIKSSNFQFNHCQICSKADIKSVQEFENYRFFYRKKYEEKSSNMEEKIYCFNFYNIIRIKLLSLNKEYFNTVDRILLRTHYKIGKIDYPFIKRYKKHPIKIKVTLLDLEEKQQQLIVYQKTTIGEMLEQISWIYNVPNMFDFCLTSIYYDKQRILGNDQFILDIAKQLSIQMEFLKLNNINQDFEDSKQIQQICRSLRNSKTKIVLKKIVFLSKHLEIKSLKLYPQKCKLVVEQIFYYVKKTNLPMSKEQLAQIAGLYYCLKQIDRMVHFSRQGLQKSCLKKIIPKSLMQLVDYNKSFLDMVINTIERNKKIIINSNNFVCWQIYFNVLNIAFKKLPFYTYNIPVQTHNGQGITPIISDGDMQLGVNYNEIVLIKSIEPLVPILSLPIESIKCTAAVFSIFLTDGNKNYRFDGSMFQGFHDMINKYLMVHKQFPHINS